MSSSAFLRLSRAALALVALWSGIWVIAIPATAASEPLRVVTTVFPAYDWVRQILGTHTTTANLSLLPGNGVDLHSYQPTAADLVHIADCDLFIHVGGNSDTWAAGALRNAARPERHVVCLLDILKEALRAEEIVEGMEEEHDHDSSAPHAPASPEIDEHVWLSLRLARTACLALAEHLAEMDPPHAEEFRANARAYIAQLDALDRDYRQSIASARVHTLLFGDRFPFRYLADDYGLHYYAAFSGCSAETEASFKTIAFLADKLETENLPAVLTIEGTRHRIADIVSQSARTPGRPVLTLDSMQSVTTRDIAAGATYLNIMRHNLDVLREALR